MQRKILALVLMVGCSASVLAAGPVSQPYRAVNEAAQWTIEGHTYGLLKVKIHINGQVVADGPMKNGSFSSQYKGRPVRVSCTVGSIRMAGAADQSCAVYVDDELAANLVFVRRG